MFVSAVTLIVYIVCNALGRNVIFPFSKSGRENGDKSAGGPESDKGKGASSVLQVIMKRLCGERRRSRDIFPTVSVRLLIVI